MLKHKRFISILLALTTLAGTLCGCGCGEDKKEQVLTNSQPISEETTERLYSVNGFTEENRRTEIKFDDSKGLNTKRVKLYIYDRMLNSLDYIDSLQGTYYHVPATGNPSYVTYSFKQGNNPQSEEILYNIEGDIVSSFYYDGTTQTGVGGEAIPAPAKADSKMNRKICKKIIKEREKLSLADFSKDMVYDQSQVDAKIKTYEDYVKLVKSRHRINYSVMTGEYTYYYRENLPLLPNANIQYQPQYYTFRLLDRFARWDVDSIKKYMGRECFVVTGKVKGTYSGQLNSKKFEMLVDKETGILMSLKAYDQYGDQSIQLTSYELKIVEN